jgi:hypothetical protein
MASWAVWNLASQNEVTPPDAIRCVAAALNAQSGTHLPPAWTANLQAPAVSVMVSQVQKVLSSLCGLPRE